MKKRDKRGLLNRISHSVKSKYLAILIIGVLLASILVGSATTVLMARKIISDHTDIMNLHCSENADVVNDALNSTLQSVKFMKSYAEHFEVDYESLRDDESYREKYESDLIGMFEQVALLTTGATTFYLRYDPDSFDPQGGFLYSEEYSHESLDAGYTRLPVTDLSTVPRDSESVEWFWKPMTDGKGMWISPYWGDNLQMNMISYVEPVVIGDKIVGVLGMDVDFDLVLEHIAGDTIYESGYAFLVGQDGDVITSNYVDSKEAVLVGKEEVDTFYDKLTGENSNSRLVSYRYKGVDKRLVYSTLNNKMRLVLVVDTSELLSQANRAVLMTIFITLGVVAFIGFIGYGMVRRLTEPLRSISEVALKIGAGEFDADIPELDRQDEVGDLARAFQNTSAHLQLYVDYIQNLAYKDSLTDVQNRAAYEMSMEQLDVDIRMGRAAFAMIMIDLNRLKAINDTYGHEIGNRYIINLCAKITDIFAVEKVYRIGGDEFIVILNGEDYENRDELLQKLRDHLTVDADKVEDPWDNVSAATGMAVFDPENDRGTDEVFKRADAEMYRNKLAMKGARE